MVIIIVVGKPCIWEVGRGELCKILPETSAGWGAGKSGHFTITLLAYEIVLLLFVNLINFLLAKWKVNNGSLPNPPPPPPIVLLRPSVVGPFPMNNK